jgi:hypothetical protein
MLVKAACSSTRVKLTRQEGKPGEAVVKVLNSSGLYTPTRLRAAYLSVNRLLEARKCRESLTSIISWVVLGWDGETGDHLSGRQGTYGIHSLVGYLEKGFA